MEERGSRLVIAQILARSPSLSLGERVGAQVAVAETTFFGRPLEAGPGFRIKAGAVRATTGDVVEEDPSGILVIKTNASRIRLPTLTTPIGDRWISPLLYDSMFN